MRLDFAALDPRDAYAWMTSTILPRPIAWVSTISRSGRTNIAPFSFFQAITPSPPVLMFVPLDTRAGAKKDTVRNIEEVPEFVVHLVSREFAGQMNATSAPLPYGESEFDTCAISCIPSDRVRPPRIPHVPVAFECTLERIVRFGDGPMAANAIFGRIHLAHVSDSILDPDGRLCPARMALVGRLGGEAYVNTTDIFELARPVATR